jgi:uracil-DNA glycosylase
MPPPQAYKFNSTDASKVPTQAETADQLTRLIRLAQLCSHERLLATMIDLLRGLMTSSVEYAYLAMKLSDELDLRTLRGAAYLEVMQKAVVVKKVRVDVLKPPPVVSNNSNASSLVTGDAPGAPMQHQAGEGTLDDEGRLIITRAQQLRLLAGYYRLTSTWDSLRLTPLYFEHSHSCGATWHQQGCTQSWLEFWKEKTRSDSVMNLGLADVLGRLKLVQKDYDRWGSATYMHHDCRLNAKKAIGDVIKRVEEALPDYFAEPSGFEDY